MAAKEAGKRPGLSPNVRFTRLRDAAMGVAKRLRETREARGRDQKDVAKHLSISTGEYENWEAGITLPSIVQIEELARLMQESPSYLAFGLRTEKAKVIPVPRSGKGMVANGAREQRRSRAGQHMASKGGR